MALSRRRFLQGLALGALPLQACQNLPSKLSKAHVVVVGGGFGGATAAKTIRLLDDSVHVTLIEPKSKYITCVGSNGLFAGLSNLDKLTVEYHLLQDQYGIQRIADRVTEIQAARRQLKLAGGEFITYDRLILSPGIDFRWDAIAGYHSDTSEIFPHAWQAGPQTVLLNQQIQNMREGGVILIAAPPDPYRCPPGPYERASLMAFWLKQHNPRAKILILDPKRSFSKQALFEAGWAKHFGYGSANSLIEWHSLADNPITQLDVGSKALITDFGDRFSGDVLNIIPSQTAARIALDSGLADSSGWCPVKPQTSQSVFDEHIHIIGDAAQFAPIPKSAFAANSEAKMCAIAVANLLNEQEILELNWINTCYSLITPDHGISVAGVYALDAAGAVASIKGSGGISQSGLADAADLEARYALSAYHALVRNTFT
jgi:sulfide dehydrogenase [flavocytochrome c] flavoprotein subunit